MHHESRAALRNSGQLDAALASFESALKVDPSFIVALRGKADTLAAMGDFDAAISACTAAAALDPDDATALLDRALNHMRAKSWAAAIEDYREADRVGGPLDDAQRSNFGLALSQRGVELDHAGEALKAEQLYDESIAIEPAENRVSNRALLYMVCAVFIDGVVSQRQLLPIANPSARAAWTKL